MTALGRRGGRAGGPARARALSPQRRSEIAQRAARARWGRSTAASPPSSHQQLLSFVAHHGSRAAGAGSTDDLETIAIRALAASRRDSSLARMLPVFLWRVGDRLDLDRLVRAAKRKGLAAALGFFLELASILGESRVFDEALTVLRPHARATRPSYFFEGTSGRPFERAASVVNTPAEARRWGLLMNMPFDSFASYFRKVARL